MSESELDQEKQRIVNMMDRHWQYFSSPGKVNFDTHFTDKAKEVQGLGLPDSVLRKIYYENAVRILGGP